MVTHDKNMQVALDLFKQGYSNAAPFLAEERRNPDYFIKALIHTFQTHGPKTAEDFFRDAGAVKWCIEQLENES